MRADIQELNDSLDMEFWLGRESRAYKLSRGVNGPQLHIRECPRCGDTRWRTYIGVESGKGNCFVCTGEQGFTNLTFIHHALGEPKWRETFEYVKEVLKEQGWRPKRTVTVAVENGPIVLPTSFKLPTPDGRNLIYLENRGIDGEIAKFFHLRFCEEGWWRFKKDDGSQGGQNFRQRVIIPVYDLEGKLATFQGRDVTGAEEDKKYLFPSGLPGTGRYLYNGQNAWRVKRLAMGEGAFDVMALKIALDGEQALRDVLPIGSFGKHLSYGAMDGNDQLGAFIQLKAKGLEEVTIFWDGEKKALLAALDAAELLFRLGIVVRIALLPAGKDPNEVAPEIVRRAFWEAKTYSRALAVKWRLRNPYAGS